VGKKPLQTITVVTYAFAVVAAFENHADAVEWAAKYTPGGFGGTPTITDLTVYRNADAPAPPGGSF
jgi:hypothetical protein